MSGAKIRQAKEAARFIVNHLGRGDEFTLVDFDDGVTAFSEKLLPATGENIGRALKFIEAIEDSGGTNINEALLARPGPDDGRRPAGLRSFPDGRPADRRHDRRRPRS